LLLKTGVCAQNRVVSAKAIYQQLRENKPDV